jgi:predicted metal-dependent hydrolase
MTEQSEIQFGLTRIPFRIRRSTKRVTVALTIDAGRLVVTAPVDTTIDRLNAVVRNKAPWVVQNIDKAADLAPYPSEREFVTGETVLYLGRHYRLRVVETAGQARISNPKFRGGWYEVAIPEDLTGDDRRREVRHRLLSSIKEHADLYLPDRLADLCHRLRIDRPSITVRDQRKRWGSCDTIGTLRINWRIVQAPLALLDYVLVHELAHLQHRGHDRAFWSAVESWLPDYDDRRSRLRALGPALEW